MKVILNPQYGIRSDSTSSYICLVDTSLDALIDKLPTVTDIPPIYGYILSQFDGSESETIIQHISQKTGIGTKFISKFVSQLINNPNYLELKYKEKTFRLPPHILIEQTGSVNPSCRKIKTYQTENFNSFNDFVAIRPQVPISVTIMLTTKCQTNCIYCYADREKKVDLNPDKIVEIIEECYKEGVMNLNLSGGDIFAYPEWPLVFRKMAACNYVSFISTKIPLTSDDIFLLRECGVNEIQFSIDSIDTGELEIMVKVKEDYVQKVGEMLQACQDVGMKVNIRTVLTKFNSTVHSISLLYDFLNKYNNINTWSIVPAFYSTYKGEYANYKSTDETLKVLYNWAEEIKPVSKFRILNHILEERVTNAVKYNTVNDFLMYNKNCLVTHYNLTLNVYGKAVLCEMFYNNESFHFDNINQFTVKDIWNSTQMKDFHAFKIHTLKSNDDSPCHTCSDFSKCKVGSFKKVCIADVVTAYGSEKWDYPDPRCPKAPKCDLELIMQ